ncbi:O-antigen/teichoic acid export membrane protein [Cryobacterium sp. MP_M5]|nr:O-antigen/teichoic acid export membrane protein [Cryobacterium sp. MP_M5]
MRRLFLRFGGFAVLPLLSAAAPLLLLPIIARVGGVDGWASVATAQAVGTFGAVAVSFGWNIAGPPLVAMEPDLRTRRELYKTAFTSRVIAFFVLSPFLVGVSALLASPSHVVDSISMTMAMAFFGFSPSWYAIGVGQPRLIAVFEALPKLIVTAFAAGLLLWGFPIWTYPVLLLSASLLGLLGFNRLIIGSWVPLSGNRRSSILAEMRLMIIPALVDMTGATYAGTPLPIVSATGSLLVTGMFASADKLYRYGMFGISALANALQAWVLDNSSLAPRRRQKAAMLAHIVLGFLGLTLLAFVGPVATAFLFGAPVTADGAVCAWFGVAYFFLSTATPLMRNLLLPSGKAAVVLRATLMSSLIGVPTMIVGGVLAGGAGVAFGLALSEALVLCNILPEALRQYRRLTR